MAQPYTRKELAELGRTLDERWPLLDVPEASYWISRWQRGISPYSRIRSHAIRRQLDAIIALALHCGLRRREIAALSEEAIHPDNIGVVVWDPPVPWEGRAREVPYTTIARAAVQAWIDMRVVLDPQHDVAWLGLWGGDSIRRPLRPEVLNRLLRNYDGEGWTLSRLRDTCGARWLNAGLPPEHVRVLLGLDSLAATVPYARLATGTAEARIARIESAPAPC